MTAQPKRKRGAQEQYSDQLLEAHLEEFVKNNPLSKLNPLQLEKQTGIPRHTWMRRMGKQIQRLKSSVRTEFGGKGNEEFIVLPNPVDIVEKNWNNKAQMISDLKVYYETIQKFYDQAQAYNQFVEQIKTLKASIEDLQSQLKVARNDADFYKKEVQKLSILSKNSSERIDKNLRNVLEIDKNNKSSIEKAVSFDFRKHHSSLFDEED